MASIFPLGVQFFDALGDPLANGTISFYAATTTTPKTIYTNSVEGGTLTNPVTLTSEGRLRSAGVWCKGDYRVIIKDSAGVTIYDIDHLNIVNPFDWTGLTATVAQINAAVGGVSGTPGVVTASTSVVVDASKNIATFGNLTAANLIANTAVATPQINDTNSVAAITIPAIASQVNGITVTPAITTAFPTIAASGSDSNIDLKVAGKGTGAVQLSGIKYPTADGSSGQVITTNGAGVLTFSTPTAGGIFQTKVTTGTATTSGTTQMPFDSSLPQNTEGFEITDLATSITPTSASNRFLITVTLYIGLVSGTAQMVQGALFVDSTANGTPILFSPGGSTTTVQCVTGRVIVSTSSVLSRTYKIRIGPVVTTGTPNIIVNSSGGTASLTSSVMSIQEIGP